MTTRTYSTFLALAVSLASTAGVSADVILPPIFSEHAVLQKSDKVPVWGNAEPGEKVSVSLDKTSADTKAGPDGKWKVQLDLSKSGPGPFEMLVQGNNKISIPDVVVGEVWICSGQSNMEWVLSNTSSAKEEIAASANPMLRQFDVANTTATEPKDSYTGKWVLAEPATAGGFTAVGYYFGKKINQELNVPVGLLNASWGGTPSEAWTSSEALDKDPALKAAREKTLEDAKALPERLKQYTADFEAWVKANNRAVAGTMSTDQYTGPQITAADWKTVTLPAVLSQQSLPDAGVTWLRRTITIPAGQAGKKLSLEFGGIRDFDEIYWNGKKISETGPGTEGQAKRYRSIPADQIQAGEAVLAIRLKTLTAKAEIGGPLKAGSINLAGEWLARNETTLPPLTAEAEATMPKRPPEPPAAQNRPAHLFNAMIHPLIPYAFQGVIWYQGESNAGRANQYRTAFSLMIEDWRARWQRGNFPFYFCQLANYQSKKDVPTESGWAALREAQLQTLSLPNTGQAVLIDIGEESDIHPRNKKDVGDRLARIALAQTYGKPVVYSGPIYESMTVEGDKVRLKFKHTDGGLAARPLPETYQPKSTAPDTVPLKRNSPNSDLEGFAICGGDGKWGWADAKIDGESVLVWSSDVAKPTAVRYAWADNPTCNLYNGEGLPASPFRTDTPAAKP